MKKLRLSLLFSTTLIIQNNILITKNIDYPLYRTNFSPIYCSNLNAAENSGEAISLGQSNFNIINFTSDINDINIQANSGNLNLKTKYQLNINTNEEISIIAKNIISSTGSNNILMIDGNGKLFTSNNMSPIIVGNLTAANALLGNITCAILQPNSIITPGNITCGHLTAAPNPGDIIFLGNSTGSINLYASAINTPAPDSYNILVIDSNNKISTSTNTTPIKCGNLNAKDTNCDSLITTNINATGTTNCNTLLSKNTICGNLSAAKEMGQNISLGNSTGSINISGSNIKNPNTNNFNVLLIDSNGNISTSNASSYLNCDNFTSNTIDTNNINTTNNINCNQINANNSIFGNLTAAKNSGQGISIGNNDGSIQINSNKITTPSTNNYNILSIDSNNNIQTLPITSNINCNTITSNITNTSTLNATNSTLGSLTAAGAAGQTITLGNSTGAFKISGTGITNPSTGNTSLLMIDSNGQITSALSTTAITCGNLSAGASTLGAVTASSLSTTGTLSAGNSTLGAVTTNSLSTTGTLSSGTTTVGSLTAAGTAGQTITLGNSTGAFKISGTGITNPSTGNTSLLMIDSTGQITSALSTTAITCGNLSAGASTLGAVTASSLSTTGTLSAGNSTLGAVTANSLSTTGTLSSGTTTVGSLTAAGTAGQTITLGNSTGAFKISGTGITNPSTGNTSLLMIDSTGQITSALSTTAITCGNLSAGASTLGAVTASSLSTTGTLSAGNSTLGAVTANSLSTTGTLSSGTTTVGSLTAAGTAGQTITLGNSTGAFKISGTGITNPSTGNTSLLMIDSTGQITSALSTTAITCGNLSAGASTLGAVTASSLSTTGTLSAGNSTLGALTANSLSTTGTLSSGTTTVGSLTAAGTAGQTITLGNSTGAFKISGTGITNPSTGNTSLLMIDSTGQITSALSTTAITCGNLSAGASTLGAVTASSLSTTGTLSAGNSTLGALTANSLSTTGTLSSGTTTVGSLTAAGTAGQTITLGNSTGAFKISGTGITNPSTGNTSLLMIDSTGQITSALSTTAITCGNLSAGTSTLGAVTAGSLSTTGTLSAGNSTLGAVTANSLSTTGTLSSGTTTVGSLTAAGTAGQTITLGNSTGAFKISGTGITNPSTGNTSLLMINSNGQVASALSTTPIICGNLSAASNTGTNVKIGGLAQTSGQNHIGFIYDSGPINIHGNGNTGDTVAMTGGINITDVSLHLRSRGNTVIYSENSCYLWTTKCARPTTGNHYLIIGANGEITSSWAAINTSSRRYKNTINPISITENIFDKIEPISFYYNDEIDTTKQLQYGFIAEDILNIPIINETVRFEKDGITPHGLDYNGIFVLLIADYLNTKKRLNAELKTKDIIISELQNKIELLKNEITSQNNIINTLITAYTINNINLKELNERYKLLENTIGEMINKINTL